MQIGSKNYNWQFDDHRRAENTKIHIIFLKWSLCLNLKMALVFSKNILFCYKYSIKYLFKVDLKFCIDQLHKF